MYCNEHEWCRNAKAWWNSHADAVESVTKADSWSSDSSDSGDIGDSNFVAYFKNSKPAGEEGLEMEELPSLTETEYVQEKMEGNLRGGKVNDGGN